MAELRVYSETLPYDEVVRPRTLELLRRYRLALVLAVREGQVGELRRVAARLSDTGIPLSVWPMIADADGRWASAHNAESFVRFVWAVADALAGLHAGEILLDLEPPFADARALAGPMRALPGLARPGGARRRLARAEGIFASAVSGLAARGVATSCAVWPLVVLDQRASRGWQALLGTPVDGLGAARVSVMMYTTILEGWSAGGLRRRDATALLSLATARTTVRWGARGGISLGCVGTGAFEDEPTYRAPSELAEDAAIARAAGCEDLSLFDLGGVLARPPAEAWLDAFVGATPAPASVARGDHRTTRVAVARVLARAATWIVSRRF